MQGRKSGRGLQKSIDGTGKGICFVKGPIAAVLNSFHRTAFEFPSWALVSMLKTV